MKKRIDALARIGRLQAQLRDLKQSRIAAIERERASLGDELGAVFEALASGALAYGAQARLGGRHVRGIEKRIEALASEREDTLKKARTHAMRAKLATQAAEDAALRYRDAKERKELAELVERALIRRAASSTQG